MRSLRENSSDFFGVLLVCVLYLTFFFFIGRSFSTYSNDITINYEDDQLINNAIYDKLQLLNEHLISNDRVFNDKLDDERNETKSDIHVINLNQKTINLILYKPSNYSI